MHIWLDDIRDPKLPQFNMSTKYKARGSEIWIKTVPQAIAFLEKNKGKVVSVSFDHDLGVGQVDGIELAKWFEEKAYFGEYPRVRWKVHSDNPVGAKNIAAAMKSAERYWSRNKMAFNKENVPELLGQVKKLMNKYEMESLQDLLKAESAIAKEWNSPQAKEKRSEIGKKKKRDKRKRASMIQKVAMRHLKNQ